MTLRPLLLGFSFISLHLISWSQGAVTGNVESTFQYLNNDTLIGANQPAEKGLINSYMNVFYTNEDFKAGMRIESYLPRIQGYPNRFDGTGLGMRYVGYENDFVEVTLGSIYEQFGSGLSLRTYEDRALGYDNFLDGARIKLRPVDGVELQGAVDGFTQRIESILLEAGHAHGFDILPRLMFTEVALVEDEYVLG